MEPAAKRAKTAEPPTPRTARREAGEALRTQNWHIYQGPVTDPEAISRRCALFSGNSNRELAEQTAKFLGLPLSDAQIGRFADGEVNIKVNETVRDKDVYLVMPVCAGRGDGARSVNDSLVELLLLISTMRRASANKIIAILPYYAYARQDRKMASRVPISAADVALLISTMGVDRVISVDLHCGQIQGFFPPTVPVDNLNAGIVGAYYFGEMTDLHKPVVVSPDAGGVARAKEFRRVLESQGHEGAGLAMIIKQRAAASQIEKMDLVGSVEGADCIIVDDMVDTAGTLCEAASQLKKHGARRIFAFITHGLLNGPAPERLTKSCIDSLVVTNTVPMRPECADLPNVKQLSLAPLLAEAIRRNIQNESFGPNMFG